MARICILLLPFVVSLPLWGQTSADLSAKYPRVTAYKVRADVLMLARFASDGQVCEMTLEKREKTDVGIVFGNSFSEKEIQSLLAELVPENERGRNLTRPLNGTIDGGFITTDYTYENVLIRVNGITRPEPAGNMVITITWPKRTCNGGQSTAAH